MERETNNWDQQLKVELFEMGLGSEDPECYLMIISW